MYSSSAFIPTLMRPVTPRLTCRCISLAATKRSPSSRQSTFVSTSINHRPRLLSRTQAWDLHNVRDFSQSSYSSHRAVHSTGLAPTATATAPDSALSTTDDNAADAEPTAGSAMFAEGKTFSSLGLSEELSGTLAGCGLTTPTRAQSALIPALLSGMSRQAEYARVVREALAADGEAEVPERAADDEIEDDVLMFAAETGSGKTLAYLAPFVEAARTHADVPLKAVVLLPSRELCLQVSGFVQQYFGADAPNHMVLSGGVLTDASQHSASANVRIILATPRALLQHLRLSERPTAACDKLIVVDEADMLLSGNFLPDVERILDHFGMKPFTTRRNAHALRRNSNRLLFVGATFPHWTGDRVKSIVTWMRRRYPTVRSVQTHGVHRRSAALQSRWFYLPTEDDRIKKLLDIIRDDCVGAQEKVMIFCSTAVTAARVAEILVRSCTPFFTDNFGRVVELHKNVDATTRKENVQLFLEGTANVIVCTDLASRGLDLGDVSRVIEFDFANNVVAYIHRIGRTARAGRSGKTDHFYNDVSRPLAETIKLKAEDEDTVVESVFSKKRSFRRKLKKRLSEEEQERMREEEGGSISLHDVEIDEMDEEEKQRFER